MDDFKDQCLIFASCICVIFIILLVSFDWEGYFELKDKTSNVKAEIKQVELIVTGVDDEIVEPDVKYYCYYPYENSIIKGMIILNKDEVIRYNWDNKKVCDKVNGLLLIDRNGADIEIIKDQNEKITLDK